MHDWQEQIEGDLAVPVRFCDATNWFSLMAVQGYRYWLDEYGTYFPEHELSFYSEYGEEQEVFYETLLSERRNYLTGQDDPKEAEKSTYTVQKGDTLWGIAIQFFGDGKHCTEIWEENRAVIGEDMNYILPGQILKLPDIYAF